MWTHRFCGVGHARLTRFTKKLCAVQSAICICVCAWALRNQGTKRQTYGRLHSQVREFVLVLPRSSSLQWASLGLPVPMAVAMALAMPMRCVGHALVRRVEVQVGVRLERAALIELPLLLRRVCVEGRAAALAVHVLVLVPQQVPG